MKIVQEAREVLAGGVSRAKTFSVEVGSHIMAVLSGLYKNPLDAIVREYLTNMFDAYVALGPYDVNEHPAPILHLPTALEPYLEFKDFGIGMSVDTVWNIYSTYGRSTKNDNNAEVGGFGLGSKTAFSYQNGQAWTIESRFNGEKHTFMASLDEKSLPTLYHASTTETDEPNGVTIRIPVLRQDIPQVMVAARKYVPYFPMDLVVQGSTESYEKLNALVEGDGWRICHDINYGGKKVIVVMGNVPYTVDGMLETTIRGAFKPIRSWYHIQLEIQVPIGSVDLVPSRDSLKETDRTRDALIARLAEVENEYVSVLQKKIDELNTPWEKASWAVQMEQCSLNTNLSADMRNGMVDVPVPANIKVDIHYVEQFSGEYTRTDRPSKVTLRAGRDERFYLLRNDGVDNINTVGRYVIGEKCFRKTPRGRKSRNGHRRGTLLVFSSKLTNEEVLAALGGIPIEKFIGNASNFSEVAKKNVKVKGKENIYRLYQWKTWGARVRLPKSDTVYYLTLEKSDGSTRWSYEKMNLDSLQSLLNFLKLSDIEVYGVRKEELDDFKSRKGWVDLESFMGVKLEQAIKDYFSTNPHISTVLDIHDKMILANLNEVHNTLKRLGVENKELTTFINGIDFVLSGNKSATIHYYWFSRVVKLYPNVEKLVQEQNEKMEKLVNNLINDFRTKYPVMWATLVLMVAESRYSSSYPKVYEDAAEVISATMKS